MRHRFSPVFTLLALCCSPLFAADLYVAPTGNDTNAGTLAAPFQTLARAQTEVRSLLPAATAALNAADAGPVTATPVLPPVSAEETQAPPFLLFAGIATLSLDATVSNRTYQLQRSYTLAADS